ncbi:hypothetical protein [Pseudomonas sp. TAF7]|uniref:hypothetical protein n=1 Tax=Pseudomonas sp. TAF7 TaxID=3233073 RepID=UPI003F96F1F8
MTNTEAANAGISQGRLGFKYAHERLFEMLLTDSISGPLKHTVQFGRPRWASASKAEDAQQLPIDLDKKT